jgi:hypothetical protein
LAYLGGGVRCLEVHERPQGFEKPPLSESQRRLRPDRGGIVGQGGEEKASRSPVLELSHEFDDQPSHLGTRPREFAFDLREGGDSDSPQSF